MKITAAESRIMEALWRAQAPLSAEDVREALAGEGWSDATVRTLLTRLVKKKAAAQAKDGRRFLYRPLIARADYVHAESKGLARGAKFKGETAFTLYDTYGFPLDLTQDALRPRGIAVDLDGFNAAMERQREKARASWAGSGEAATEATSSAVIRRCPAR